MTEAIWLWIGTLGMAIGTVPSVWLLATEGRHRTYYGVLAMVTGIAAVAYLSMALGVGNVGIGDSQLVLTRYVDWLLTTPLLVLYLGMLCQASRRVYVALVTLDVFIIGAGVLAGLSSGVLTYLFWGAGVVAYVGLLWLLLVVLPAQARLYDDRVDAVFTKLRNLTVVLWSLYPAVWLLGPLGIGLLGATTDVLVVTYLDLISKVGFVFMAVRGRAALDALTADDPATGSGGRDPEPTPAD